MLLKNTNAFSDRSILRNEIHILCSAQACYGRPLQATKSSSENAGPISLVIVKYTKNTACNSLYDWVSVTTCTCDIPEYPTTLLYNTRSHQ